MRRYCASSILKLLQASVANCPRCRKVTLRAELFMRSLTFASALTFRLRHPSSLSHVVPGYFGSFPLSSTGPRLGSMRYLPNKAAWRKPLLYLAVEKRKLQRDSRLSPSTKTLPGFFAIDHTTKACQWLPSNHSNEKSDKPNCEVTY